MPKPVEAILIRAGHGGGDMALMQAFVDSLHGNPAGARTTAKVSLASHLLAFAVGQARKKLVVIETRELA